MNLLDLSEKIAIVTGGAMGIGRATAEKLLSVGATVAIFDINAEQGTATAEHLSQTGKCMFAACDVSDSAQVAAAVDRVKQTFGGVDILVSNAGRQDYGDVVTTTEQAWDGLMDTNVRSAFLMAKSCVPLMLERGGGAIVIVGSVQSMTAIANSAAYVTSKHALLGLTRSIALDFATRGIRANCVCPGAVDTPMLRWAASLDPNPDRVLQACDRLHAMGRMAKPQEIADAIVYLASPMASFVTGAALVVDGGLLVPAGGMGFQDSGTGAATHR